MLSELDVFFEVYPPKLGEETFHGSGGSVLAAGEGINVIDPSELPNERPADSGGGYALSGVRKVDPNDPKGLGRDMFDDSRANEPAPKGFASNDVRRSGSVCQSDPSLAPKVREGGACVRNVCTADGVFSLDDVRSSSSSIPAFISFSDIERESVADSSDSSREELGPELLGTSWDWEGDRGIGGNDGGCSSGIGGGADSDRCVGGGMAGAWKRVGAGICSSSGLRSALPMTSFIAARSNPAVFGRVGWSGIPESSSGLVAVGVREGDVGVGTAVCPVTGVPSRGGRSSSKVD